MGALGSLPFSNFKLTHHQFLIELAVARMHATFTIGRTQNVFAAFYLYAVSERATRISFLWRSFSPGKIIGGRTHANRRSEIVVVAGTCAHASVRR
jgi:hypothetical protein